MKCNFKRSAAAVVNKYEPAGELNYYTFDMNRVNPEATFHNLIPKHPFLNRGCVILQQVEWELWVAETGRDQHGGRFSLERSDLLASSEKDPT